MVACADPTDPTVVDELRGRARARHPPGGGHGELDPRGDRAVLRRGIHRAVQKVIETMGEDDAEATEGGEDLTSLRDMAFDAPVVRLVNLLIENAIKANASDVHIEPFEDTLRVRYRIDGVLFDAETPPKRLRAAITSRIKIMAELNIAERRLPQDGRIRMSLEGRRSTSACRRSPPSTARASLCGSWTGRRSCCRSTASASRSGAGGRSSASSACPTACCWSRGRPAPGRPRRSTPRSTRSTRLARRSSPSRTRSSTSWRRQPDPRQAEDRAHVRRPASGTSCARTRT